MNDDNYFESMMVLLAGMDASGECSVSQVYKLVGRLLLEENAFQIPSSMDLWKQLHRLLDRGWVQRRFNTPQYDSVDQAYWSVTDEGRAKLRTFDQIVQETVADWRAIAPDRVQVAVDAALHNGWTHPSHLHPPVLVLASPRLRTLVSGDTVRIEQVCASRIAEPTIMATELLQTPQAWRALAEFFGSAEKESPP